MKINPEAKDCLVTELQRRAGAKGTVVNIHEGLIFLEGGNWNWAVTGYCYKVQGVATFLFRKC